MDRGTTKLTSQARGQERFDEQDDKNVVVGILNAI